MTNNKVLLVLGALEEPLVLRKIEDKQLNVQVKLTTVDTHQMFCKQILVNLGNTSLCISQRFIKENNLNII